MGHAERDHALLSASGAHRWLLCTSSAKLEEQFPDTTSEAAREGTLAHELAELKVRNYFNPADISKRKLNAQIKKMKENELWQDEMLGHTDTYIDYIRDVSIKLPSRPYVAVEKRLDLGAYVPEGFGTADCIMLSDRLWTCSFQFQRKEDCNCLDACYHHCSTSDLCHSKLYRIQIFQSVWTFILYKSCYR